jgi:hypothetical protein
LLHARTDHVPLGGAGSRGYSSLHIRRGDFQYKQVKKEGEERVVACVLCVCEVTCNLHAFILFLMLPSSFFNQPGEDGV